MMRTILGRLADAMEAFLARLSSGIIEPAGMGDRVTIAVIGPDGDERERKSTVATGADDDGGANRSE